MNDNTANGRVKRIGLFDSGVGGLSILRFLEKQAATMAVPVKFVYFADTARCPYGNRTSEDISRFVDEIVSFLDSSGVDRIVMACNTSAAVAAKRARDISSVPVHDLILPTANFVAQNYKRVGVIATSTTCQKKAFSSAVANITTDCEVIEIPAPDLVPLVESGKLDGPEVESTIQKYVDELKACNADSLIFGCTHFPFLEDAFRKLLPSVAFIDPAVHLSMELLGAAKPSAEKEKSAQLNFRKNVYFTTGSAEAFSTAAERCLGLSTGTLSESICSIALEQIESFQVVAPAEIGSTSAHAVLPDQVLPAPQMPTVAPSSF